MFWPVQLAPVGPAVTMEPASSLEVVGKAPVIVCGWNGEEAVEWASQAWQRMLQ